MVSGALPQACMEPDGGHREGWSRMVRGAVNRAIAPELEDAFLGDQRESATNRVTQPGRLSDEEDFAQATFPPAREWG
jgi:hypothetical protein